VCGNEAEGHDNAFAAPPGGTNSRGKREADQSFQAKPAASTSRESGSPTDSTLSEGGGKWGSGVAVKKKERAETFACVWCFAAPPPSNCEERGTSPAFVLFLRGRHLFCAPHSARLFVLEKGARKRARGWKGGVNEAREETGDGGEGEEPNGKNAGLKKGLPGGHLALSLDCHRHFVVESSSLSQEERGGRGETGERTAAISQGK
jgi:hypothetical protein